MSNKILVTDSLFIKDRHVKMLEKAGFKVERLDKPAATEEELCEAVKGKVGYILGGIEKVTQKVIDSADILQAIVFTGTGWQGFIPGHKRATEKGIKIGAAPHLNAHAVAEFGMTMTLIMCRDAIDLARDGKKTFETTRSLSEIQVGILGLGHIGKEYAVMAKGMGATELYYANRTRYTDVESDLNVKYLDKDKLFSECDLIFVSLAETGPGERYVSRSNISSMKDGAILVSTSDPLLFDQNALLEALGKGKIRAAFDENIENEQFQKLPIGTWYTPNASTAFNTGKTVEDVSTSCVNTLINLLKTGKDKHRVNW